VNIQIHFLDVQFDTTSFKKEISNQMPICQECKCAPNQQLVCKECYDEMVMRLGNEIRSLQNENLELRANMDILGALAKAGASKFRESRTPPDRESVTEVIDLLKDKQ
jgi:hypothetical protein